MGSYEKNFCIGPTKDLDYSMAGLGSPSQYKAGVKKGLFVPAFGRETPKTRNWYKLTPLGREIIKQIKSKKQKSPQKEILNKNADLTD